MFVEQREIHNAINAHSNPVFCDETLSTLQYAGHSGDTRKEVPVLFLSSSGEVRKFCVKEDRTRLSPGFEGGKSNAWKICSGVHAVKEWGGCE